MIRNQWYAVLESREVGLRPLSVVRLGERLLFYRTSDDTVVCLLDRCAHRGAALSAGDVAGDEIRCPFHGLTYDRSGKCTLIPSIGKNQAVPSGFRVRSYAVAERHEFIWIFWGDAEHALPEVPFFDDIDDTFAYTTVTDPWSIHYSRAVENQLDVSHLPFVHANTIGRGGRTVVDGPVVDWLGPDRFRVYVYNRRDDGTPPRKPAELPQKPATQFHLEFAFPHLWQNHLSAKARIVVAFVPVDEENTLLYMRFYQKFVRLPLLRTLICRLAMIFNMVVLHQDRRVVLTQRPRRTALKMGEHLFPADFPIIEYRRRREELQKQSESVPTTGEEATNAN